MYIWKRIVHIIKFFFISTGSCVDSGFTGCCTGEKCEVVVETSPLSCYCDSSCYIYNDCCDDIVLINCYHNTCKAKL